MDEDKVLAKLQELKSREEAKRLAEVQAKAKADLKRREIAIEQEALRRYEESKVNDYIEANDIEGLMLYAYEGKITKFNLNEDNKNHWQIIKDIFLAGFKYFNIKLKLRDDIRDKRIYNTILNHIESKIQTEKKEAEDLRKAQLQEEERLRQVKLDEQMIQDFNNFMSGKFANSINFNQGDYSSPSRYFRNKIPEFEKLFWNRVISRGCFDKCPSCKNNPKVIKRVDYEDTGIKYTVFIEGFYTTYSYRPSQYAQQINRPGEIKYISCCEHLFNLDDNKRYIQADKVGIKRHIVKLTVSTKKEQDYILYDPEDPYKIKAKREKDIAETTQEIETLRAKLVDAIERLNLLRTAGSGEGSGEA